MTSNVLNNFQFMTHTNTGMPCFIALCLLRFVDNAFFTN